MPTVAQVQEELGSNYGPRADGSLPDLQQQINRATLFVNQAVAQAVQMQRIVPDGPTQDQLILLVACHFYCNQDPLKQSKSTGGASASYVSAGSTLDGEGQRYKREAIELDPSGLVNAMLNRKVATAIWMGKPPSQQIPYDQRN
jgi:hypothetical protein